MTQPYTNSLFSSYKARAMRIEKVKQTLRKVNALIDNLDSQGSTSAIERDLLKRYLTDLYEEVARSSSNVIVEEPSVPDAPATVQSVEPSPVQQPNIVTPQENQPVAPLDQQTTYYDADAQTTNGDTDEAPVADASINQFSDSSKYFPPEQVEEVVPTAPEPVKLQESISPQETAPVPTPTPEMETEVEVAVDESRF